MHVGSPESFIVTFALLQRLHANVPQAIQRNKCACCCFLAARIPAAVLSCCTTNPHIESHAVRHSTGKHRQPNIPCWWTTQLLLTESTHCQLPVRSKKLPHLCLQRPFRAFWLVTDCCALLFAAAAAAAAARSSGVHTYLVHRLLHHHGHPRHLCDHITRRSNVVYQPLLLVHSLCDIYLLHQYTRQLSTLLHGTRWMDF